MNDYGAVGGRNGRAVLEVDLVLADGDLMVAGLNLDAHLVEGEHHVLADRGGEVGGEVEVAAAIMREDLDCASLVSLEEEELQLRTNVVGVAQARPASRAACRARHAGSPANGSPFGVCTQQMTRAVVNSPRSQGMIAKVERSTSRYMSDSAMRGKPAIEEPSIHWPPSTT